MDQDFESQNEKVAQYCFVVMRVYWSPVHHALKPMRCQRFFEWKNRVLKFAEYNGQMVFRHFSNVDLI